MLHRDFFRLSCANRVWNMSEPPLNISVFVDLFLREETICWEPDLLLLLHIANNKYWVLMIPSHNLIQLYVVKLNLRPTRVPPHNKFFILDPIHHTKHFLVVDVVEKPNIEVVLVFFKRHRIAISHS